MRTIVSFNVEIDHDGALNFAEMHERFIEPIKQSIRTADVLGPDNLITWRPAGVEMKSGE